MQRKQEDFWEDVGKQVVTFLVISMGIYLIDALAGKRLTFLHRG